MPVDDSNQQQADFWIASGPMWTKLRDRFDDQAGKHGLAAIDALAPMAGEVVIDIGCGAGTSTLQIADRVGSQGQVLGVDISATMIEGATEYANQQGVSNVKFDVGDAMVQTFAGDADAVYSRFGLMFFSDATKGFTNVLSALRPGGRLGFVCWQSPVQNPWIMRPLEVASRYVELPFGADPTAPGPFSLADPDRIQSVLAESGFADVVVDSRLTTIKLGADLDDAIEFLFGLMAPTAALRANEPERAEELRLELVDELGDWEGPNGVESPSAS